MNSDRQQPTRAAYTGIVTRRGDETMLSILVLQTQDNSTEGNTVCIHLTRNPAASLYDRSAVDTS